LALIVPKAGALAALDILGGTARLPAMDRVKACTP